MSDCTFAFYIKKETKVYTYVRVFKICNNDPIFISEFKYLNGSNRGAASEVKDFLVFKGIVAPFGDPNFYNWLNDPIKIKQM